MKIVASASPFLLSQTPKMPAYNFFLLKVILGKKIKSLSSNTEEYKIESSVK